MDTGAESRCNLSRSQKIVMVQDFNRVQMCVSGCNNHYKFVMGAGAKAKSVTNNLPILSVLCAAFYFSGHTIIIQGFPSIEIGMVSLSHFSLSGYKQFILLYSLLSSLDFQNSVK
jgi:hypothetical protein